MNDPASIIFLVFHSPCLGFQSVSLEPAQSAVLSALLLTHIVCKNLSRCPDLMVRYLLLYTIRSTTMCWDQTAGCLRSMPLARTIVVGCNIYVYICISRDSCEIWTNTQNNHSRYVIRITTHTYRFRGEKQRCWIS